MTKKVGRPLQGNKLRKRVLYSIDENVVNLFNKLTQDINRSQLIEEFMRKYIGKHGQDSI